MRWSTRWRRPARSPCSRRATAPSWRWTRPLAELLKPENKAALDRLLKYHVVKGYLAASELVKQLKKNGGKGSLPTLSGQTLVAGLSPEGKVTLTDPEGHVATITSYDQPAFNGLVHVTDVVMVPATPEDPNAKKKKKRR